MSSRQDRPSPFVLANKPSSSFSSVSSASSAASATSAGSLRSGGSRLLFGEIDTSSDRSSESYASVCSFVLCDSATFLKFWLDDACRDRFLSYLPNDDLASLRLACHDFSVRAAPALFSGLSITFKTSTFTKPAKLAALDRLGFYVETLHFNLPHSTATVLTPLVEPETGEELSFTYTPQLHPPVAGRPKYGDTGTNEILIRQYPSLFHAATNVPAFIRAFSAFVNLKHLIVSCPGYDVTSRYRRSTVDFALISLRIAVEQNCLNALQSLTLAPIHPGGLLYLSPGSYGATPRSHRVWSRIRHLHVAVAPGPAASSAQPSDHVVLLRNYLSTFSATIETLNFQWDGEKGPFPFHQPTIPNVEMHPAMREAGRVTQRPSSRKGGKGFCFQRLKHAQIRGVNASDVEIRAFINTHKRTIEELDLDDINLEGSWDDALAPLTQPIRRRVSYEEIPIMLSTALHPVATLKHDGPKSPTQSSRPSMHLSKWLFSSRRSRPVTVDKVRDGLQGCEAGLKKMLGGVLPWK